MLPPYAVGGAFPKSSAPAQFSLPLAGNLAWASISGAGRLCLQRGDHAVTTPGFERVDINSNGVGCKTKWRNNKERAPSVVPKLSLATGLIYASTKPLTANERGALSAPFRLKSVCVGSSCGNPLCPS
jgi:hypothetical protein